MTKHNAQYTKQLKRKVSIFVWQPEMVFEICDVMKFEVLYLKTHKNIIVSEVNSKDQR